MDLNTTLKRSRAFNEQNPSLLVIPTESRAGSGLKRTGSVGGLDPATIGAITAALSPLIEKAATAAPGIIWKGAKKVGSWFKRLFGRGLMPTHGGFSRDPLNPEASYHNRTVKGVNRHFYDLPSEPLIAKDMKRLGKINTNYFALGGTLDADLFMSSLNNPKFVAKLEKCHNKPHKFFNAIVKNQMKASKKKD